MAAFRKSCRGHFYHNNMYKKLSLITVYVDSCIDLAESCFTSLFLDGFQVDYKKKKVNSKALFTDETCDFLHNTDSTSKTMLQW